MSELHIPPEVADAMRALRPELRKKLSLRDIDDMTRPFRDRIRELEESLTNTAAQLAATISMLDSYISLLDSYGMRKKRPTAMSDYDLALEKARKALEGE